MSREAAYFVRDDVDCFLPTAYANSHWGADHLGGPAVVALAARVLEERYGDPELRPARLTVDLVRAARTAPTVTEVRAVRDGRRIRTSECDLRQHGQLIARATLVQYRAAEAPPGRLWRAEPDLAVPAGLDERDWSRLGSAAAGWSPTPGDHQNDSRKRFLHRGFPLVAGQDNTPLVRAAMVAEATSLVTNLGTHGIGYINGDLSVGLTRLPHGEWLGVHAESHWAHDGIAVGSATLYDDLGPFGTGLVTALANPAAQIDFTGVSFAARE
ncbi:thioesterase family protein [Mycobacterium sp. 1274756.6]|uniref:thioesterase family protein n=1 Tax=Mycobacterium sp. 1274756.6 TaxID=1834076 RepID=UPI00080030D1|nr:thioesterase family protein [Mycobacterium sp. 1274756.6]OBJ69949.1 thioesterase [Mycobacterium sp. 1274756.6]